MIYHEWYKIVILNLFLATSLVAQLVKNLPAVQETGFDAWVRKILWRRKWQPTPVFLPGEFHGQRSQAGYSLGRKELNTTEQLTHSKIQDCKGGLELPDTEPWVLREVVYSVGFVVPKYNSRTTIS